MKINYPSKLLCFLFAAIICLSTSVSANLKLNSLFADHMVLQKGAEVPIWGWADNGEEITVAFHGQSKSTVAKDGKWMVKLLPLPYITEGETMTVSGNNKILIKDVLVGEVWLCSGQSNMERQLGPRPPQPLIDNWKKERDAANYPLIREFYVPPNYAKEPVDDANGNWEVCSPETVSDFSAVGYFFAQSLYEKLKVPVGILFSAYGGTPGEDWTRLAALESNSELRKIAEDYTIVMGTGGHKEKVVSGLYNGMIYPLIPAAIKGVAWFQGENNGPRPKQYAVVLENLIKNWRTDFKQGDFPFLIVQLTPFKGIVPELRESQFKVSQKIQNTALIVTTDCGDDDIHSPYKRPVGERLALAARGLAYNEKIEFQGPTFESFKIKGNKVILTFSHTGKGLTTKNNEALKGFVIAGADKNLQPAQTEIKGKKIIVYNPEIKNPTSVRYGWANIPDVNLYNKEGLPASPFRTDNWDNKY